MYTRAAFDRQRDLVKRIARRDGRLLAVASVSLGVAQLVFLGLAEGKLPRRTVTAIAGAVFLAYMALVVTLVWRMDRRITAAQPRCPNCGKRLKGLSERVAGATGRCDSCGGQVIE